MTLPAKKKLTTTMTVYELPIYAEPVRDGDIDQTRRPVCAGLDQRQGQTVEKLQPVQEAAGRLGWTVYRDDGSLAPTG